MSDKIFFKLQFKIQCLFQIFIGKDYDLFYTNLKFTHFISYDVINGTKIKTVLARVALGLEISQDMHFICTDNKIYCTYEKSF